MLYRGRRGGRHLSQRSTIALIAHDGKKADLVSFAHLHTHYLSRFRIIATGTTGSLMRDKVGLTVESKLSGPMGGDAQIATEVAEGTCHLVVFFRDPLGKHPHDPDILMLMRVCDVHNVPLATNAAAAELFVSNWRWGDDQTDNVTSD